MNRPRTMRSPMLNRLLPPGLIDRADYKTIDWEKDLDTILRKISLIEKCLPVESVIDFGGMWEVDGLYSRVCSERFRIARVTMVDKYVSENWVQNPRVRNGIDFRKGDFSDEEFMSTLEASYDLALAYDVLPHQRDLIHTLNLMLSKTSRFFLISQPILPEKTVSFRNSLVLLSGSKAYSLIPFREEWAEETDYWANFSDATVMDTSRWIWGMTPSFIESIMRSSGWKLVYKEFWRGWLPKSSKWRICGLIFKGVNSRHEANKKVSLQ